MGKTLRSGELSFELAVAAVRPVQRASSVPDIEVGAKLDYDGLLAYHTAGATTTSLDAAAIGVSAIGRRFAVDELSAAPRSQVVRHGYGLSVDLLVPIVPASKDHVANALTLTASFVAGKGIADLYTGLTGGVTQPSVPGYLPNVDAGTVVFSPDGSLHAVPWTTYVAGAQYYLPPAGKVWFAVAYSRAHSDGIRNLGSAEQPFFHSQWADANVFVDVTPAIRLGSEFAWFEQTYTDETHAVCRGSGRSDSDRFPSYGPSS